MIRMKMMNLPTMQSKEISKSDDLACYDWRSQNLVRLQLGGTGLLMSGNTKEEHGIKYFRDLKISLTLSVFTTSLSNLRVKNSAC